MAQVFPEGANTLARLSIVVGLALTVGLVAGGSAITRSSYNTKVGVPLEQPVPFSHEHHVTELGLDCRYCHATVEKSSFAGIPPTYTCMSCHSQIWTNSPLLHPVRQSLRTNTAIRDPEGNLGWARVNKLPEFVYFNHSIHISRGINCNTCHGPIQTEQLTYKGKPFFMSWCVNCHRHPEGFLGPKTEVFQLYVDGQRGHHSDGSPLTADERAQLYSPDYQPSEQRIEMGEAWLRKYKIRKEQLTDCSVCHH